MAEILSLPELPLSPMFIGDNRIMTIEWQEFFRILFTRAGGPSGPSTSDSLSSVVSQLFDTPTNYTKRIEGLEHKLQALSEPKSYDKRISKLEKELERKLQVLAEPKVYDKDIKELKLQSYIGPSVPFTKCFDWVKIVANGLTLSVGTSADALSDLQTAQDGNFYRVTEVAGTPGIILIVDFAAVTTFTMVRVLAIYDGSGTHSIALQLYNYTQTRWDTFDSLQTAQEDVSTADGYIVTNHSFFVLNPLDYISGGVVQVRFYHTMGGNASHDLYIDSVALYK